MLAAACQCQAAAACARMQQTCHMPMAAGAVLPVLHAAEPVPGRAGLLRAQAARGQHSQQVRQWCASAPWHGPRQHVPAAERPRSERCAHGRHTTWHVRPHGRGPLAMPGAPSRWKASDFQLRDKLGGGNFGAAFEGLRVDVSAACCCAGCCVPAAADWAAQLAALPSAHLRCCREPPAPLRACSPRRKA